jgi:hypothetical protein
VSSGDARPVGSSFSPLDQKLHLGTEGYSPTVLRKAVRQAGKALSFQDASDDLEELLQVSICPSHLFKLAERIGREWASARDADVQAFRTGQLAADYAQAPVVATVMVDGGRVQTRAEDSGRGVVNPAWREIKVACCQTLSSRVSATDPQPEPPRKFLDPVQAARLAAEMKSRGAAATGRAAKEAATLKPQPKPRRRKAKRGPRKLVRTVVASMVNSEEFGWQVAAEVQRRGLDRAQRKGYICDGQKYNWSLFEFHLLPMGFIAILDFLHLLAYLYAAAHAIEGKKVATAWASYERWLREAWAGQVSKVLAGLRAGCAKLGPPPRDCSDEDPRKVAADALGYVENNRERMDYPRYRRLGLPISSAAVESVVKQMNRRIKGTEKFWKEGGAEAMLQVRAAYVSEDGRVDRYWSRPRPHSRAVGNGRLRP